LENINKKTSPHFEINLPAPIWQIRADEKNNCLALETREADTLQNAFYVLDAQTGRFILPAFNPVGWGGGLEDIYAGFLYLHRSTNKKYGRHEGIIAIESKTGTILWERPNLSFYGLTPDYLVGKESQQETADMVTLDFKTGIFMTEPLSSSETLVALHNFQSTRQQATRGAHHYPENNMYFPDLSLFLQEKTGIQAVLAIDYLETSTYFVIGYYVAQPNGKYDYQLAVYSLNGDLLLTENLKSDSTGIGIDNFFILNQTLVLIKDRNLLLGYVLN